MRHLCRKPMVFRTVLAFRLNVGLMAAVVLQLGEAALVGWPAWVIAAASAAGLFLTRVGATWWILAGGIIGIIVWLAGWAPQLGG